MFWKKRGLNQVDWSISLGIFLIYIAWFFMLVKPQILDGGVFSYNTDELKDSFFDLTDKEISIIPVFVSSENTLSNQLIELDVSFLEDENYGFDAGSKPYLIEDDIIYVIDNLSNSTKIYNIIESSDANYSLYDYNDMGILEYNGSVNPNSKMTINFDTSIESIYFNDTMRVEDINIYQNGNKITSSNFSFDNKFLFGEFLNSFDTFSISDKLVSGSDYVQTRIKKIDKINNINLSLEFDLLNYTSYYIDNDDYGTLESIEDGCVEKNAKNIKLVDDTDGIYFVFTKKVDITLCNGDGIQVWFNFSNQNIKSVMGFNSNNNLSDIPEVFADYDVDFGINKINEYPLVSNIVNLSDNDFASQYFQGIEGFRISVYNTTSIETDVRSENLLNRISGGSDVASNVFSEDEIISVQDDYGNIQEMILNVMVW